MLDMRKHGNAERPGLPARPLRPMVDTGEPLEERPAIVEFDEDHFPVPMCRMRTLVEGRHKLTVYPRQRCGQLFDLEEDPHETRNLWRDPDRAHVKARMMGTLVEELAWSDRMDTERLCGA